MAVRCEVIVRFAVLFINNNFVALVRGFNFAQKEKIKECTNNESGHVEVLKFLICLGNLSERRLYLSKFYTKLIYG